MSNFFIIRNKEKNMYYFGNGIWTKIKDCARKNQHKDCAETLIQIDRLDYKICEVIEIPSIADLEAKLEESEKQCRECKHLNKKIELNIKSKLMNEIQQLKQQLAEKERYIEEQEFAEYKEMFYATQELKEDCELKILELENQCAKFAQLQNEKAIAELENVKKWFINNSTHDENHNAILIDYTCPAVVSLIDQKIAELRGNK